MKPPIDRGVVLVTGASSGIGRAFAVLLAPRARTLILVARRKDRLETLREELIGANSGLEVIVAACDLGDLDQTGAMLDAVQAQAGPIDVLINNAGFGDLGVFDMADWSKTAKMIDLNVTSLTFLTHRLVGGMVERKRGGILNVSSGWGLTFAPGLSAYIGTKHYVTAFTEALRLDLTGTGVVVTQSCPGPVATEFNDTVGNFTGMNPPRLVEISAERCARSSLRAFDRGRALVIPGFLIWILTLLGAWTPRVILRLFYRPVARVLRKKQATVVTRALAEGTRGS